MFGSWTLRSDGALSDEAFGCSQVFGMVYLDVVISALTNWVAFKRVSRGDWCLGLIHPSDHSESHAS